MPQALWVPGAVADSILADKAGQDEAKRVFGHVRNQLKALDPRLDLFLMDRSDPDNELRMGFYYVTRRNEDGTQTWWEISGPRGEYVEPNEGVVEAFRRWDANSRGNTAADRAERRRREEARKAKREQDWRERKAEELKDEADFAFRVQHRVPSLPWKKGE